jgi:signal transduction histidine kinase/ActR/RegA family two-component response regulator
VTDERRLENRVLVTLPTGRDAELVCEMLGRIQIECYSVDPDELADEIRKGAGALLIAEEALRDDVFQRLEEVLREQPVWSDLPIVVFSSSNSNADNLLERLSGRFNATIVERPIRITMLISAARGALRARQRQYQARDLLSQLKQADQQKDLFLATLSHELRTPLNSIIGWMHILRRRDIDDPDIRHALDVIDRNAQAQSEMISDILFISRVITGKVELAMTPVQIESIVATSIDIILPSAETKNIEINFNTAAYTALPVEGDPERLQQIVLNLLTNAVKFTPEGGKIDVVLRQNGNDVEIEVRDNGSGIDPRFLPYIFERFRQADSKQTRRVGGLGLGLAIVSHLVELHGGSVTAYSEGNNKGSRFVVTLPIIEAGRTAPSMTALPAVSSNGHDQLPLKGLRILVVEDDADSRDMLETILRFHGADVLSAKDVVDGFNTFLTMRPDILISDVGLPELDGYDLIRRIRALAEVQGGKTPAIAVTGYVSIQDQSLALSAGYQEHLPKPIDTDKLINSILKLSRGGKHSSITTGTY